MKEKQTRHCETCGDNYAPVYHSDGGRNEECFSHTCRFPAGTYFEFEALEFKYEEGIRYERRVKATTYSGHHREGASAGNSRTPLTEWERVQ